MSTLPEIFTPVTQNTLFLFGLKKTSHISGFCKKKASGKFSIFQSVKQFGTRSGQAIRIYHKCEGRIEKSVPRITVCHHKACRVMTNGNLERRIFLSYPHTNNGFFFLLIVFFLKINFQKSLNTLRCNFT